MLRTLAAEYTEIAKDHGRIEKRKVLLDKDPSWFDGREGCSGLKSFYGRVNDKSPSLTCAAL
jgi:hypothetical protein